MAMGRSIAEGHGFDYNELREVWLEALRGIKNNRLRHRLSKYVLKLIIYGPTAECCRSFLVVIRLIDKTSSTHFLS
ncbi:hypothetical protein PAECIP111891_03560 [Paenibacillus allorhizoplanae]|uniref:Uncharacterized protein n=1 Tax=Paenibacillus allorhizoplanae TaxID=2905648 RepID=A0ABM9CG69_9BACL|nr:hypothetical protein [Paenibacillus allorhizoplanae]CAH1210696.1 hypothetical protein PAECIP111891_03560 [Paenibacillus allorhizoplanae]